MKDDTKQRFRLFAARRMSMVLDVFISLAILLTGFTSGILAEAKIGLYNQITGKRSAQVVCGQAGSVFLGSTFLDARWKELPEITPVDTRPAFVYWGSEGAASRIRIQVFLDYECPFSQQYVRTVLPELLKRDDVQVEFYDFPLPFHPDAEEAAQAGRCAAYQGHYTEFLTALADYGTTNEKAITLAAGAAGLDVEKLLQCLPTQESNVKMNLRAAQEANIGGTPTTLINGRAVVGALPWETFERLIKEAEKGAP